ncbi:SRPBCC family protein [Puniceicoccaceae bacterium K14]|nr:SRPBCC family protein [Puniceicoccaceae bacterium K14]
MPKFSITKSTTINSPQEMVFTTVRDFHQWPTWSPWLIAEPDCDVNVAEDGMSYTWDGKIVGSGKMEILDETPNNQISYRLTFLTPWKSVSSVSFSFQAKGEATEVTWTMDGSLPFFLFWMKKMMVAFVGMDYERGLSMLKDYCETGNVPSKLGFNGTQSFQGFSYIGLKTSCSIADMGDRMKSDFENLWATVSEAKIEPTGKPFSIYHKHDPVSGRSEYTIGVPIVSTPSSIPSSLISGTIASCETWSVTHTGPYRHLGNPWSAGMMYARAKAFKQQKGIHPFEVYDNDPTETSENDLQTTIHFAVK